MTSIALLKGTKDKLRELKKELGFRSHDALLNHMALEIRVHRGTIGLCAQIILRTRI